MKDFNGFEKMIDRSYTHKFMRALRKLDLSGKFLTNIPQPGPGSLIWK